MSNLFFSAALAGIPVTDDRAKALDLFVLDDWKVSRGLTLNFGMRLEVNGQPAEVAGRESNFFPQFYVSPLAGHQSSAASSGFAIPENFSGAAPPGVPRVNGSLINNAVQVHPEPRFGFAWRPLTSNDFVVRGGYGIYASRTSFAAKGLQLAENPPFALLSTPSGGSNATASLQKPVPNLPVNSSFPNFAADVLTAPSLAGGAPLLSPSIIDPAFKEVTVQHYGVDLQYQHKSYVFSVAYGGAKGTHLALGRNDNQPILASPSQPVNGLTTNSTANAAERVPFLGLAPLLFRLESSGTSIYHSLQASVKKDLSDGVQLLVAYTFSKSMDDAGDTLGSNANGGFGIPIGGLTVFNDQNNVAAQRGVSDFDRTHRIVLNAIWNLPSVAKNRGHAFSRLANGWTLSSVVTLQSGLPFSILDRAAGTLYGPATLYTTAELAPGATTAEAARSGSVSSRLSEFFNTKAFVSAPYVPDGSLIDGKYPVSEGGTTFGNLGRNILRGPNEQDWDIALTKSLSFKDRVRMNLRWEVFNLLNRSNFANPANDISSPTSFGVISGMAVNPRIMQYALKLQF